MRAKNGCIDSTLNTHDTYTYTNLTSCNTRAEAAAMNAHEAVPASLLSRNFKYPAYPDARSNLCEQIQTLLCAKSILYLMCCKKQEEAVSRSQPPSPRYPAAASPIPSTLPLYPAIVSISVSAYRWTTSSTSATSMALISPRCWRVQGSKHWIKPGRSGF